MGSAHLQRVIGSDFTATDEHLCIVAQPGHRVVEPAGGQEDRQRLAPRSCLWPCTIEACSWAMTQRQDSLTYLECCWPAARSCECQWALKCCRAQAADWWGWCLWHLPLPGHHQQCQGLRHWRSMPSLHTVRVKARHMTFLLLPTKSSLEGLCPICRSIAKHAEVIQSHVQLLRLALL